MIKVMNSNSKEEEASKFDLRRGPWSSDEDNLLTHYIACHGEGRWNSLAKSSGLRRTGKSCRLRWLNYLKPDIKRGNLSPHEQLLILELHFKLGNRWSKIAQHLPGRTDNEIKNYWRTRVQKQARQLRVDSNSSKFLETIRSLWIPRLLEKTKQTSSPSHLSTFSSHSTLDEVSVLQTNPIAPWPLPSSLASKQAKTCDFQLENSAVTSNIPMSHVQNNVNFSSSNADNFCHVEMCSHAAECLGHPTTSTCEWQNIDLSEYHMAEGDCFNDDLPAVILWSTDEE